MHILELFERVGSVQNVTITGIIGEIKFDGNGDMMSDINVYQYQSLEINGDKSYSAILIGTSRETGGSKGDDLLNMDLPVWTSFRRNESAAAEENVTAFMMRAPLESVCSRPCRANEFAVRLEVACCWRCMPCRENEVCLMLSRKARL